MPEGKDPWSPAEREAQGREAVRNLAAWPEPYNWHGVVLVEMPPYPDDKGRPVKLTYRNRLSADEA